MAIATNANVVEWIKVGRDQKRKALSLVPPMIEKKELLARIKQVQRIRKKGVSGERGRLAKSRESLAREALLRSTITPQVKKLFGASLKAIVLTGSSQLGVRLASTKRKESDLDVLVVVDQEGYAKEKGLSLINVNLAWRRLRKRLMWGSKQAKIELQLKAIEWSYFVGEQRGTWHMHPFQVVYGKEWVEKRFGEKYLERMREGRREYTDRNPEKKY
ncbi:MAG: hypothetical protein WCW13_02325 [archaeon]|jgi:hypothetical protein